MQSGLCCQLFDGIVLWQLLVLEGSPRWGGGGLPVGGGPQSQSVKGLLWSQEVEEAPCLYASVSSVSAAYSRDNQWRV